MEGMEENFEKKDNWRNAILQERENLTHDKLLQEILSKYEGGRTNALILGDASLVQAKYFLETEHFSHVVDVDSSPTLLDEVFFEKDDKRIEKVLLPFDRYVPSQNFDFIYGKSIAFNQKTTTQTLLNTLRDHLEEDGLLYAVWGGEGDSYRRGIEYSLEELQELHQKAGLSIVRVEEKDEAVESLLNRSGRGHTYRILAKKI
jgi:hypothetical protein